MLRRKHAPKIGSFTLEKWIFRCTSCTFTKDLGISTSRRNWTGACWVTNKARGFYLLLVLRRFRGTLQTAKDIVIYSTNLAHSFQVKMTCNFLPCIYWKSWLSVGSVWFSNTWWVCCGGWSLQWRKRIHHFDIDRWWRNRASCIIWAKSLHHFWTFRFLLNVVNFHAKLLPPLDESDSDSHRLSSAGSFFHDGLLGWFVWLMLILNHCNLPKKGTLAFYLYSQYFSIHLVLIIHTDSIYITYSTFEICLRCT